MTIKIRLFCPECEMRWKSTAEMKGREIITKTQDDTCPKCGTRPQIMIEIPPLDFSTGRPREWDGPEDIKTDFEVVYGRSKMEDNHGTV